MLAAQLLVLLAAIGEYTASRPVPLRASGGEVRVREGMTLHGIPVRGAYRVRVAGSGRVLAVRAPVAEPQLRPREARVTRFEAALIAADALDVPADEVFEEPPELVYLDVLGQPVLAWEGQSPLRFDPDPTRPKLWISAATGVVLHEEEQVWASRARVYANNPASTPVPIEAELSTIDATEAGVPLQSPRLAAYNCSLPWPEDAEHPWWGPDSGRCLPGPSVFSDADGNFEVPLPDVRLRNANVDDDDRYAELSMYYHAERFLDMLEARGVDGFRCDPSERNEQKWQATMVANYRFQEPSKSYPQLPWGPLNNAFYTNQCHRERGATMLFGQGSSVDFGFDGDVVYHELGHGVVAHLTQEGLGTRRRRSDALVSDAGGLNEAIADYLSASITGDPFLGDYVGFYWPSYTRPYIRSAKNTKRCPDNMNGQVHNDGEAFMAALWSARERVAQEPLDLAVLELLTRVPKDADVETASAILLEIAGEGVDAGTWAADDLSILRRALEARGLLDCPRVITDPASVRGGRTMHLRRRDAGVTPFWPGPMQLRHEVTDGSDNLVVTFKLSNGPTWTGTPRTDPVFARVLVKVADEPIEYSYNLVALDDPLGEDPAAIREVTRVSGDWDHDIAPITLSGSIQQAILRGLPPGQVVHVAVVNVREGDAVVSEVRAFSVPTDELDRGTQPRQPPTPGDDPTGTDSGFAGATGAVGSAVTPLTCSASSREPSSNDFGWLALCAAFGLRRRRRWPH